jgi:hypothetical protein
MERAALALCAPRAAVARGVRFGGIQFDGAGFDGFVLALIKAENHVQQISGLVLFVPMCPSGRLFERPMEDLFSSNADVMIFLCHPIYLFSPS